MKERPILFSAPMVRAILSGQKTQTRRIVKKPTVLGIVENGGQPGHRLCPYGAPGDRLWVRETFGILTGNGIRTVYRADGQPMTSGGTEPVRDMKWHPSIFMRRHQSRIDLEVTAVRVERLWSITDADALAEGVFDDEAGWHKEKFRSLWTQINGIESWPSNPWVWVVEFKRINAPMIPAHTTPAQSPA